MIQILLFKPCSLVSWGTKTKLQSFTPRDQPEHSHDLSRHKTQEKHREKVPNNNEANKLEYLDSVLLLLLLRFHPIPPPSPIITYLFWAFSHPLSVEPRFCDYGDTTGSSISRVTDRSNVAGAHDRYAHIRRYVQVYRCSKSTTQRLSMTMGKQ